MSEGTTNNITVIERPKQLTRRDASPITTAVLATADTDKAVRIEMHGRTRHALVSGLYIAARRRGLVCRISHRSGDSFLIAWCEKRDG